MKQDALSIEHALAAAVGSDAALAAELQAVFFDSASRHALSLAQAATVEGWRDAAWRLKGNAASFGATALMAAADVAAAAAVRDPRALAAVAEALGDLID